MLTSIAFSQSTYHHYDSLGRNDSSAMPDGSYVKTIFDAVGNPLRVEYHSICDTYSKPVITGTSSICKGDSVLLTCTQAPQYLWNTGDTTQTIWVKQTGSYSVKVTYPNECEKTSDTFYFSLKQPSIYTQNISICRGDSVTVFGNIHTINGIYRDSLKYAAASGCDTIVITNLTTKEPSFDTVNVTVCSNQIPYLWNGNNYTTSATYFYKTTNAVGCDSTAILNLSVLSNSITTIDTSICSNSLPFVFGDTSFNVNGNYTIHKTNSIGCDSTINLSLTIVQTTSSIKDTTLCPSALPFTWNGLLFNATGSQTAHFSNSRGCDSAATLNVIVLQSTSSTSDTNVCRNSLPLLWNGLNCDTVGAYTYHSNNAVGCDSLAILHLFIKDTSTSLTIKSICSNQFPFLWNGTSYNTAGTYVFTTTNVLGCDSLAILNLTITDTSTSITDTSICSNALPFLWNSHSYNSTGKYTTHFTNFAGCDSVATLNLIVKDTSVSNDTARVCRNSLPYYWNANNYISTGNYTIHFNNSKGCDSTANLHLLVLDTTTSNNIESVCSNQLPFHWNGNDFYSQGTYLYKTKGVNGCDSIATLILTVKQITVSTTNTIVCKNQLPYIWNAVGYNAGGTYTFTTSNSAGCDSIATLNLTVNDTSTSLTNQSICSNQLPFVWNGITCNTGGVYTSKTINGKGCDSIATLNLTVKATSISATNMSICDGISYTFNGTTYTSAGTYQKHLTNAAGCDSTATLVLTIKSKTSSTNTATICSGDSISFNNVVYKASGNYVAHLINAQSCDSAATLVLTVLPKVTPTITINTPVTSVCIGTVVPFTATITNGGTNPTYQWKKNGNNVGSNSSTYNDSTLNTNDSVWCILTSNSPCITTSTVSSIKKKFTINLPLPIGISTGGTICTLGTTKTVSNTNTSGGGSNTAVATVITQSGATGIVTGVSNGTAILTYIKTSSAGCISTASCVMNVAAIPTPANIVAPTGICRGATTTLSTSSIGGKWSSLNNTATIDSITGVLTATNTGTTAIRYAITNQYGCSNFSSLSIPVYSLPNIPAIQYAAGTVNPQTGVGGGYCIGRTFTVVGSPSGGKWTADNSGVISVTSTGGVVTIIKAGVTVMTYTYTDVNGCSNSRTITGAAVSCPNSRSLNVDGTEKNKFEFLLNPNPAHNIVSIIPQGMFSKGEIIITDYLGRAIKHQLLSLGVNNLDISKLSRGTYFVKVITDSSSPTPMKLVVE